MNVRIHIVIAFLVLLSAYLLGFSALEFCMVLFAIAIVIISEMLNTAIEFTLDSIYHNRYSKMVGMAKDISAGAVMFASFISMIIGIILFGKHLLG
jgi:diacylglycerol kinase